jgi:hypothetical protein
MVNCSCKELILSIDRSCVREDTIGGIQSLERRNVKTKEIRYYCSTAEKIVFVFIYAKILSSDQSDL